MAVEREQKRALRIIFGPDLSYEDALARAGLLSLEARRQLACKKFVTEIMHASPLYPLISSRVVSKVVSKLPTVRQQNFSKTYPKMRHLVKLSTLQDGIR